jgi:hypothetical protein
MPDFRQRPKVTIEDLLRLKRAERPAAEFWNSFDRELRQKQLSALLEKRPWWHGLPQRLARRAYLPVGATAILAFTLVSIKYYVPAQVAQAGAPSAGAVPASRVMALPQAAAMQVATASSPLVNRTDASAPRLDDRTAVASPAADVSTPSEYNTAELMPVMVAPQEAESPSARSFAANLARLEQSEPELVNAVIGSRLSAPVRAQTASMQTSELASVPTDSSKRSRILAQYSDRQLSPEPTAPEIVRERLVRRLADPEITDRISRLGLRGDAVSLKF